MSKLSLPLASLLAAILVSLGQAQDREKPIFQAPKGWRAVEAGPFAAARFFIEGDWIASVTVMALPGDGGGLAANANRWRGQLGLPPWTQEDALKAAQSIKIDGIAGHTLDLTGPEVTGKPGLRILVAVAKRADQTWYFLLRGPAGVVGEQKADFDRFLKSVRFEPAGAQPAAKPEPNHEGTRPSAWVMQLKADDRETRARAADALARMSRELDATIPQMRDAALDIQNNEAMALMTRLGAAAVPALTQSAWDENPGVRAAAIYLLGRIGWDARPAAPALIHALGDQEKLLRRFAADALGDVDAWSAIPKLVKLLDDPDAGVRIAAAKALITLDADARTALAVLVKELDHADLSLAVAATEALSRLGPEATPATSDVAKLLSTAPVERHRALLRVLQEIGPPAKSAVPALKQFARDNPGARLWAAIALWTIARDKDAPGMIRDYLKGDRTPGRAEAAIALWQMDAPDGITALVDMAKAEKSAARAMELLGQIGPEAKDAVGTLVERLTHAQWVLRLGAAHALGRIGPSAAAALPALAKAADDDNAMVRAAAALAACRIRPERSAVAALGKQLAAKLDPNVWSYAARGLGGLGEAGQPAVPVLKTALTERNELVRLEAATALWRINRDPASLPALIALLGAPDAAIREQAARTIGYEFGAEGLRAVPSLVKLLWDPAINVPMTAAEELARIGPNAETAVAPLVAVLMGDGYHGTLSAACEALGRIGADAKAAAPELKRQLAHPRKLVQVHAALALLLLARDDSGAKALEAGLNDRDYRVRITSAEGLWRLKQDERVPPLLLHSLRDSNLTDDPDRNNEVFMAIRALGRIGPRAKEAVPALARRLAHYDNYLVETAANALRQIDPEAAKAAGLK
jgi:HEAT repeat protein